MTLKKFYNFYSAKAISTKFGEHDYDTSDVKLVRKLLRVIVARTSDFHKTPQLLHLFFWKTYDYEIWQAGTSRGVESL